MRLHVVYPPELPRWQWLGHYTTLFDTVELYVTYYRHADRKTASGWVQRTPDGFLFTVKAHGSLTHELQDPEVAAFRESLAPLTEQGRLGCVLAQFPHSFHATPQNADYLDVLRDHLGGLPVVVEFRDAGWLRDETFEQLRRLQFGFCCVDEPQLKGPMPPLAAVTGPLAYVRLHGRNADTWESRTGAASDRFKYLYSDAELNELLGKIRAVAAKTKTTFVIFNNHKDAKAFSNALQLKAAIAPPVKAPASLVAWYPTLRGRVTVRIVQLEMGTGPTFQVSGS